MRTRIDAIKFAQRLRVLLQLQPGIRWKLVKSNIR
jgi:hypothetical protein